MRKTVSVLLFISLISILVVISYFNRNQVKNLTATVESQCEQLQDAKFSSQRSLGIIVRDNTLLVVKLPSEKNFSPPGGHIDANETPAQALKREAKEELNINIKDENIKPYRTFCEVIGSRQLQRTYLHTIDSWEGNLAADLNRIKWIDITYREDPKADTELIKSINFLIEDKILN